MVEEDVRVCAGCIDASMPSQNRGSARKEYLVGFSKYGYTYVAINSCSHPRNAYRDICRPICDTRPRLRCIISKYTLLSTLHICCTVCGGNKVLSRAPGKGKTFATKTFLRLTIRL